MILTLDSSVIISALRQNEEKHSKSRLLLESVKDFQHITVQPYIVLVEVVASIKRRTNSQSLALRVKENLLSIDTINFVELESVRAEKASEIAAKTGLKGMDAIIVQIAQEFDTFLVTLDEEMVRKVENIIKIKRIDEF
ncbi:TPA: type II toxin-antitoxin system VapC family toxin [bacterium]|nr:type II toxin-antitoxin system VapC family toxin [bacterium]